MADNRLLYLECLSGISGDMTVAALLDLGADREKLLKALATLGIGGYQVEIGRATKNGIEACDFRVTLEGDQALHEQPENQNESADSCTHQDGLHHNHHHERGHFHEHPHGPGLEHSHEPGHGGHHHDGTHPHRNIHDICLIIDASKISERAKRTAKKIFDIVAQAEAKAHGLPLEKVHFHEVGAVDSIVDIVAASVCLDDLNIDEVIVTNIHEGTGHVHCQHGVLPVPVPAVANIAAAHKLSLVITDNQGEMVIPTGAAIAAAIRTKDKLPESMIIHKIGLGAGKREYRTANLLRAMLVEEIAKDEIGHQVWVLETNLDDSTGEALGYTLENLLLQGARDAYFSPVFMKKNRPAVLLTVVCDEDKIPLMEQIIFTHTTTIGIRRYPVLRTALVREELLIPTPYGSLAIKKVVHGDKNYYYPEYESVKLSSELTGQPYDEMYHSLKKQAEDYFKQSE